MFFFPIRRFYTKKILGVQPTSFTIYVNSEGDINFLLYFFLILSFIIYSILNLFLEIILILLLYN